MFETAERGAQHRVASNTVNVLKGSCQITTPAQVLKNDWLLCLTQCSQNLCRVLSENGIKGRYQRNPGTSKKKYQKMKKKVLKRLYYHGRQKKANMFLTTDQCADLFVSTPRAF